jgi:hypothetical protein
VEAAVSFIAMTKVAVGYSAPTGVTCPAPAGTAHSDTARSATIDNARSYAAATAKDEFNTFDIAAAGDPVAPHAAPVDSATCMTSANDVTTGAIVPAAASVRHGGLITHVASGAPPLDWGDTPFDVGTHLDFNAPAIPLSHMDSDDDAGTSISYDDSIFIDL